MSIWILVVMAGAMNGPEVEVAKYPTEAACRIAQRKVGIAMADALDGAIEEPNPDGYSFGPAMNCKEVPPRS
ncbi:hypothetical protein AADS62_004720 [Escherichia coli]